VTRRAVGMGLLVVFCLAGAGCVDQSEPTVDDRSLTEAAEILCPVMWTWVKGIGGAFNAASGDVASVDSPDGRRARWGQAFDEMISLNEALDADLMAMTGNAVLAPIVGEILRDLPLSSAEVEDIRRLLTDQPDIDELRHQERTMQLIVRVEKVISLAKPSMAGLDPTGDLIPAFREVPSCQHALDDVDDGTPQANG